MQGRIPPVSNSLDKIQLDRLAHVSFAHPDLQTFDGFANAFGFEVAHRSEKAIYYRGWGKMRSSMQHMNNRKRRSFSGLHLSQAQSKTFTNAPVYLLHRQYGIMSRGLEVGR